MPIPVCTRDTLIAGSGCLSAGTLTIHQQKVLKLYFMAKQLAAIGGTDYSAALSTTLVADSKCKGTLLKDQMIVAELVILKNNAVAAGAVISSSASALTAAIACGNNMGSNDLDAAYLHLLCLLGYGATYPQTRD